MSQPAESFTLQESQSTTVKPRSAGPNLRSQQRVPVELSAVLSTTNGEVFETQALNVSRAGMQIECDMACLTKVLPSRHSAAPGDSIEIDLEFSLPLFRSQPTAILARAEIIHVRRVARDRFRVGLQFAKVGGNGYLYLEQYVSSRLGTR